MQTILITLAIVLTIGGLWWAFTSGVRGGHSGTGSGTYRRGGGGPGDTKI